MTIRGFFSDWRKILIYTHRWLGIVFCLIFVMWFVSGIAILYWQMPRLTAEERLMRMSILDLSSVGVSAAQAAANAHISPSRVRIAMLDDRPIYRFSDGAQWAAVYADTGEVLSEVSADDALAIVRRFVPQHASTLRYEAQLDDSDQWTLTNTIRDHMPLHKVALGDTAGTHLYVSTRTGEPVLKTDARSRFLAYGSAVLHWTYFPFLRRHTEVWASALIWGSGIGSVMCLSGLVLGVWRLGPTRRYRLKGVRAHSPYAGFMKWHHYAGLLFGAVTLTWVFSGMLSLEPWEFLRSSPWTPEQLEAAAGGPVSVDSLDPDRLRRAAGAVQSSFAPREMDFFQFQGEPYLISYRPPSAEEIVRRPGASIDAFQALALNREHVIVSVLHPDEGLFTRFPDEDIVEVASAAMPDAPIEDSTWLSEYDAYYYDRNGEHPLPVLRVRYRDSQRTWLYLNPHHGLIAMKHERASRLNRWLYHGLHSLDFPFLYNRRPLWDLTVIGLCIGGIVLSTATLVPALRRLRRRGRYLRTSPPHHSDGS